MHPLFSKEKQKEKSGTGAKGSKPSAGSSPAKRSSKPVPKSDQRPLKASQKSATELASAGLDAKQPSEIQNKTFSEAQSKKPAKSATEVSVASDTQQTQSRKGGKEKGSKIQAAFAPQPTKLRMAPISPDAIADPYQ